VYSGYDIALAVVEFVKGDEEAIPTELPVPKVSD